MYVVYSLEDPRYSTTRYIGITDDLYRRFSQHMRCEGNNIDKNIWVQECLDSFIMPIMRTVEIVDTLDEAREREEYWIKRYTSDGAHLLNILGSKSFTFDDFLTAFGKEKEIKDVVKDTGITRKRKKQTVSVRELAEQLNVSERYVRMLRAKGILVADSEPGHLTAKSVNAYLASRNK